MLDGQSGCSTFSVLSRPLSIGEPRLGFLKGVFLANHLANNDNLAGTTKRQNTLQLKLTIHKRGPNKQQYNINHAKI